MDFEGNALAPNVLTIKRDISRLSTNRLREGKGKISFDFPIRRHNTFDNPFARENDAGERVYARSGFGLGVFLESDCRSIMFGGDVAGVKERASFKTISPEIPSTAFLKAGLFTESLIAPLTIFAVSPFVMLVDTLRLGDKPVPSHWGNLLDPMYKGEIVLSAEDAPSNIAVMSFYALFGENGLFGLLRNVAYFASASVMAGLPGRESGKSGSIYIIPWFFARCCSTRDGVCFVWPEEGALCFPQWLTLNNDATDEANSVVCYFMSAEFAKNSTANCLPHCHAASEEAMPSMAGSLHWVGWDFLRKLDADYYKNRVAEAFSEVRKAS